MKRLMVLAAALLLALPATAGMVVAQDGVTIKGDPDSEALAVVQQFLAERNPELLAEDVQYMDQSVLQPGQGRDNVLEQHGTFFGQPPETWQVVPTMFVVADDTVVVEYQLTIREDAAAEALATYQGVTVPLVGIYTVQDGQITAIRRYYDQGSLQTQVGQAGGAIGLGGAVPGAQPLNVGNIIDDFDAYEGQSVSVTGFVEEPLTEQSFVLSSGGGLLSDPDMALVLAASPEGPVFGEFADDESVVVTGTVRSFSYEELQDEVGYELSPDIYGPREEMPVIVAIDAVRTLP